VGDNVEVRTMPENPWFPAKVSRFDRDTIYVSVPGESREMAVRRRSDIKVEDEEEPFAAPLEEEILEEARRNLSLALSLETETSDGILMAHVREALRLIGGAIRDRGREGPYPITMEATQDRRLESAELELKRLSSEYESLNTRLRQAEAANEKSIFEIGKLRTQIEDVRAGRQRIR
jgi:hypothetical protein